MDKRVQLKCGDCLNFGIVFIKVGKIRRDFRIEFFNKK